MIDYEWETRHGERILVRDMGTSHIENAMRVIEKRNFLFYDTSVDCDFYDDNTVNMRPVYERMRLELRMRQLEKTND